MEFSPANRIVQLCLKGMSMEDNANRQGAAGLFNQAWNESTNDFERFLAAYFIARNENDNRDKLKWFERSLQLALNFNNEATRSALRTLYSHLATCYQESGNMQEAQKYEELASNFKSEPTDIGPFYHGTRADLKIGELLKAGGMSNYKEDLKMNHIYFTALISGAGLAASLAKGEGRERIYIVEPTGPFENDPNVTDKKFPGNLTRSYRSELPLKITGEVTDWTRHTPEDLQKWRGKLASNNGDIIN